MNGENYDVRCCGDVVGMTVVARVERSANAESAAVDVD
jgi:hypothetical protein